MHQSNNRIRGSSTVKYGIVASAILLLLASLGTNPTQAAGPPVKPAPSVTAELTVLYASNDASGIDPKIGKMPALEQPPFSSYNSYKLLERRRYKLPIGSPVSHTLEGGSIAVFSFKEYIKPVKKGEAKKYLITASIQSPGGKPLSPLVEFTVRLGETVFGPGSKHKSGVLVVGIKVSP